MAQAIVTSHEKGVLKEFPFLQDRGRTGSMHNMAVVAPESRDDKRDENGQ